MTKPFYEQPVLNSPYHIPTRHHALGPGGQPLDHPLIEGRRRCGYVAPVPAARKQKGKAAQSTLDLGAEQDAAGQAYAVARIVDEIRQHVASWRALPNAADWGVTPSTARLLEHWRNPPEEVLRPFFCQVEAIETLVWLTEVARGRRQYAAIFNQLEAANKDANPELFRLAMKMATGSGKTTVMAMLIAWQTINAVRSPNSGRFARGFLIIAPGITIRDRLRVLQPSDPENYYATRHLVPHDMRAEMGKAKIVIANYHAFGRRRVLDTNKTGEAVLSGWRACWSPTTRSTPPWRCSATCGTSSARRCPRRVPARAANSIRARTRRRPRSRAGDGVAGGTRGARICPCCPRYSTVQ